MRVSCGWRNTRTRAYKQRGNAHSRTLATQYVVITATVPLALLQVQVCTSTMYAAYLVLDEQQCTHTIAVEELVLAPAAARYIVELALPCILYDVLHRIYVYTGERVRSTMYE